MLPNSHGSLNRWKILYRPPAFGCGDLRHGRQGGGYIAAAFSLLEVVIALGVVTVGIVAILGVVPTALQTGHSAQDETRAAHIAQSVFGSLVANAPSQFTAVPLPPTSVSVDLTASSSPTSPTLYADNDGNLVPNSTNAAYAVFVYTNNSVPGFTDPGTANLVTVRVAWPANAPPANQTFRDYVRIVSKY
jgi:uncharacterized protein (TIGR02598 family)